MIPDQSSSETAGSSVAARFTRTRSASSSPLNRRNDSCSLSAASFSARMESSRKGLVPPRPVPAVRDAERLQPGPAAVEGGEHPGAVGGEGEGVLEVRGPGPVAGRDGPLVVGHVGLLGPQRHHRLDREGQAPLQLRAAARAAHVGDVRGLVHRGADPVTGEVLQDAVRLDPLARLGLLARTCSSTAWEMSLTRPPRRAAAMPGPERLLGDPHQLGGLRGDLAHGHGDGRVAVPAVDDRAAVDRDDVAVLEHPGARDPVHHLVVDRGADGRREGRVAVPQERGHPAGVADVLLRDRVELTGADAGDDPRAEQLQRLRRRAARRPASSLSVRGS